MKFDTLLECFYVVIAGVIVSGFWLMHRLMFCTRCAFLLFFPFFFHFSFIFCQNYSGKQSIRIEMTGWFKHYFHGNLRRNFLFTVCNYTSYESLQKTSLPNPFAREKAKPRQALCLRMQPRKHSERLRSSVDLNMNIPVRLSNCTYSYRIQQDDTKKDM